MKYAKKLAAGLVLSLLLSVAAMGASASGEPEATASPATEEPVVEAEAAEESVPADEPVLDGDAEPALRTWIEPGSTDAAIRQGGWYRQDGDTLYYSDGGLWAETGSATRFIAADDAANLNLAGAYLYYTVPGGDVRRVPVSGGVSETVFSFGAELEQLYVMGAELRFLAHGGAYSYDMDTDELTELDAPAGAVGLIPTPWGDVFLTGAAQDYTLWAGTQRLCGGVSQTWRDGDWLVIDRGGELYEASLEAAFAGDFAPREYDLHRGELSDGGASEEEQLRREAAYYATEDYAAFLGDMEVTRDGAPYYVNENSKIARTARETDILTQDQKNMLLRAQWMMDIRWTALGDIAAYGSDDAAYFDSISSWYSAARDVNDDVSFGTYAAGHTYSGIPYSQPVYNASYVGWNVSVDEFLRQTADPDSKLYSERSTFYKNGPYYGCDCSAFVSWVWDTDRRGTITTLADGTFSQKIGKDIGQLRIGDCIDDPEIHVVLVTDIGYDAEGKVVSVEITEQTPWLMRTYCFGELFPGRSYYYHGALWSFQYYYLGGGYDIYRRAVETPVAAPESLEPGDANRDGAVDARDAAFILRYRADIHAAADMSFTAADADRSGAADRLDAALVLRKAVEPAG